MKIHLYTLMIFVWMFSARAGAQTQKFYTTDNGLSNSLINQIYQDRKGFVWVATEWGLNKFDSNKFSVYNHVSGDRHSLTDNYVRVMYEDGSGRFFIGLYNGFMVYNPQTDSFSEVTVYGEKNTVIHPNVSSIVELANRDLLIGTSGKGIFILDKGKKHARYFSSLSRRLNSGVITTFFRDRDNNLWIAAEMGGLYFYNVSTNKLELINDIEQSLGDNISSLEEDRIGNIFIGSYTKGLFIYNKYKKSIHFVNGSENLLIKHLFLNRQNEMLVGTDGQGLKMFDYENDRIVNYPVNTFPYDITSAKVHTILEDKDQNLWLGLFQKGIVFIPSVPNHFQYWGLKQNVRNPIGMGCVMAVCKDHEGNTLVSIDNEGIYMVDKDGKRLAHYQRNGTPSSISNIILTIHEDRDGTIWLGSYTSGLCRMDKRTGECHYVPELKGKKVYFITQDREGFLLVATYGAGFFRINPKSGQIEQYLSPKREKDDIHVNELPNNWVNVLLSDRDGMIWIGHTRGLTCYDLSKKTFIKYGGTNNILPNRVVISLMEAKDGKIWIGTTDGLVSFDKKTRQLEKFTTQDKLPNNAICAMKQDSEGHIWISTYHGLSKFSPSGKQFVNYYIDDGIQGYEFTRGASYIDKNGIIYFGGTNGLTFFDPAAIISQQRSLKLMLTDFYVGNHRMPFCENKSIGNVPEFTLSDKENSFGVELSSMDYANAERVIYQYKLEGWNKEWASTAPGVNRINFANLPSGEYTLRVKVSDNNALSLERAFRITICSPWYATWWAYLVYTLFVSLLLAGSYKYYLDKTRYKKELQEQERAQAANESRLQYFINISHEIRTPMSLIISPLEKLMATNKNEEIQKTYLIIQRNANRILRLINQLMDVRKLDKGQMHLKCRKTDIVGFVKDVMLTFDYQSKKKNIDFQFTYPQQPLYVWIDLNNFDKVMLNLFSNAFKFTAEGGVIDIELSVDHNPEAHFPLDNYFQIIVADTGIGVSEEHIEKIFDRFYQVDLGEKVTTVGTGVGLHLARQLVALHSGIIYAENRTDVQGSRFIVRLPMGYAHLKKEQIEERALSEIDGEAYTQLPAPIVIDEAEMPKLHVGKSKTNYKILIVEDDDEIRSYLASELSPMFKVIESRNGREGYESILSKHPDLVVSDIMMPEMDGINLCRKIKQNININHIPVILLTAKSNPEDRYEGLETGADAYLLKPFHLEDMVHQINNLIRNRELLKVKFTGIQDHKDMLPAIQLKSSDEILLEKVLNIIHTNLSNPELNVVMLASGVGMSRVHMHRKLKELMNLPARDLIRSVRLKQAAVLLQSKKLGISEVAYATGFSNLSHFSNAFKDFYGKSPSDFVASQALDDSNQEVIV